VHPSTDIAEHEIADLLDRLVAKSLIAFDATSHRYRCLETVKQYAREQQLTALDSGGEDPRPKHARFFYHLVTSLKEPSSAASIATIEADYENLRQALDWWSTQTDGEEALKLATHMYSYWYARGLLREGLQQTERVLDQRKDQKTVAYGDLLFNHADFNTHLGNAHQAKCEFEEILAIAKENKDARLQSVALSGLAGIHQDHWVDYHLSREYRLQALELAKSLPDSDMRVARHYYNLGDLVMKHHPEAYGEGRKEVLLEARSYFEKAQELSKSEGDSRLTFFLYAGLGGVSLNLGDIPAAIEYSLAGLKYSVESGYALGQGVNLALLGFCAEAIQKFETCAVLLGGCIRIMEEAEFVPGKHEIATGERSMKNCSEHLGKEAFDKSLARGQAMSPGELLKFAQQNLSDPPSS